MGRYDSPEILASASSSPIDVCRLIFALAEHDEAWIKMLRSTAADEITRNQRHAITWVSRKYLGASFPQIGRALNRDHSVAIRSYNRAKLLRMIDPEFVAICDGLAGTIPKRVVRRVQARTQVMV